MAFNQVNGQNDNTVSSRRCLLRVSAEISLYLLWQPLLNRVGCPYAI
jgi:hypothetical protein